MFLIDVMNEQIIPIIAGTVAVLILCVFIWRSV